MNSFLSESNVEMLVEILLDDKPDKTSADTNQILQEINLFCNTQMNSSSSIGLLELNQQFLKRMVQQLPMQKHMQQQQQQQQQQQPTRYKVEDLKAERMDFFDKQLAQRRNEFESAITLKKPPPPVFEDQQKMDKPITDFETLLAQRNLEMSSFLSTTTTSPQQVSNDWLSPASTSIKLEKEKGLEREVEQDQQNELPSSGKKITWMNDSIFSKLKQTPTIESLTERILVLETIVEKLANTHVIGLK